MLNISVISAQLEYLKTLPDTGYSLVCMSPSTIKLKRLHKDIVSIEHESRLQTDLIKEEFHLHHCSVIVIN